MDIHIKQYLFKTGKEIEYAVGDVPRSIDDKMGEMEYTYKSYRDNIPRIDIHYGQRKLFLAEIDFFNETYKYYKEYIVNCDEIIVLYIGAAIGTHIILLSEMYPKFTFHLYDKTPFDPELFKCKNVVIFQEYFYEANAKNYDDKNVLFISDIRNIAVASHSSRTLEDEITQDNIVDEDNDLQASVYRLLKNPVAGTLKFRLPYHNPTKLFLQGDIRIQIWCGHFSTENRLIMIGKPTMVTYDCKKYESRCYYNNVVNRFKYYFHNTSVYSCHCYNCYREQEIISIYLEQNKNVKYTTIQEVGAAISKITKKEIYNNNTKI